MLALPQFDTYKILKAYAEDPSSVALRYGLELLKRSTQDNIIWSLLMSILGPKVDFKDLVNARLGVEQSPEPNDAQKLFQGAANLSQEERDTIYMKLCGNAGIRVTQADLDRMRENSTRH